MNGISSRLDDGELKRAYDRRLSIAVGASLVIHALTIAAMRGLPAVYGFPQPGPSSLPVLRAVLEGPKTEPAPAEPSEPVTMLEPEIEQPPAEHAIELPKPPPSPPTGPPSGGNPARAGADTPEVSIAVGMIDDPSRLGAEQVAMLVQRFPQRVARPPVLLGSPIIAYPPEALSSGLERRVEVLLTLGADGSIAETQLVHDDPLFGPPVLDAIKTLRFAPAEIDGKPVPYWAIVEVVFSLGRPRAPVAQRVAPRRGLILSPQPSVGR
ncbi:MAG TPA: energy transducer TonB [Casimicrobiaceae bacterium]|nr:energy transducer TonB [Casimicrobiaceae bacterium]